MLWSNEASLAITVHTAMSPTNHEWDAYLADIRGLGPLRDRKVVVVSFGGGPNGAQRRRLIDQLSGQSTRTVIFTDNAVMRGIGIAVSWFNRSLRVFGMEDRNKGYSYLGLSDDEVQKADATIQRLSEALEVGVGPSR